MGSHLSKQLERRKAISTEKKTLADLDKSCGCEFPGCDYIPSDRKNWMSGVGPEKLQINKIVWPGTHDSATNKIGIRFVSRPFAQCQSLSIYDQLLVGTRVLDIRVQEDRRVCHGILKTYSVDVVLADVKRFLSETESEIVILEIRTEFGHEDPPEFDKYLVEQLGDYLIHQDNHVFTKKVSELLPKRVICIWKPRKSPQPKHGDPLWSAGYLKDNWIDTDLPWTKFESNIKHLSQQQAATSRNFFYRVENTVTPQADNPILCVKPVTKRIHCYAKAFIIECVKKGCADKLQIFSTDFVDKEFVDACVGLTSARAEEIDEKLVVRDVAIAIEKPDERSPGKMGFNLGNGRTGSDLTEKGWRQKVSSCFLHLYDFVFKHGSTEQAEKGAQEVEPAVEEAKKEGTESNSVWFVVRKV